MKRYDVDRNAEVKYRACLEQVIARLKSLPGDVWSRFCSDLQGGEPFLFEEADRQVEQTCLEVIRSCSEPELEILWIGSDALWKHDDANPSNRAGWEEGVLKELYERVRYAAGDASLDGDEEAKPTGNELVQSFRFDDDDLVFLSKVARKLAQLTARPSLAPENAKAIRRAVAALKRLPELTPEINVQIAVVHRMGGDGFSESYSYAIKLARQCIELSSGGTQYDPAVGANSFNLESLKWYANGQAEHQGNRDTWLERLAYALAHEYTVNVRDESADKCGEPVQDS